MQKLGNGGRLLQSQIPDGVADAELELDVLVTVKIAMELVTVPDAELEDELDTAVLDDEVVADDEVAADDDEVAADDDDDDEVATDEEVGAVVELETLHHEVPGDRLSHC